MTKNLTHSPVQHLRSTSPARHMPKWVTTGYSNSKARYERSCIYFGITIEHPEHRSFLILATVDNTNLFNY